MSQLLNKSLKNIKSLDKIAMAEARARQDELTKPKDSLGRLEELSIQIAGITGKAIPEIRNKVIIVMAADHGVTAEKVSLYPQSVTAEMVKNFLRGKAAVNVLANDIGAGVTIVDIGVASDLSPDPKLISRKIGYSTGNMARDSAMSYEQAVKSIETGIEIVKSEIEKGADIIGTGDMGIGNTTASSAISAVMTGKPVAEVTGRGTGVRGRQLTHKIEVIESVITLNKPDRRDPLDVLAKVGGFEIGGLAGVMLGAASLHVPVVIDGFISGAAALIATALSPKTKEYLIAGHVSAEAGHRLVLKYLGLKPLLNLKMRLGEGTGAVLGISLAEASCRILNEMATFTEAGVSGKE